MYQNAIESALIDKIDEIDIATKSVSIHLVKFIENIIASELIYWNLDRFCIVRHLIIAFILKCNWFAKWHLKLRFAEKLFPRFGSMQANRFSPA